MRLVVDLVYCVRVRVCSLSPPRKQTAILPVEIEAFILSTIPEFRFWFRLESDPRVGAVGAENVSIHFSHGKGASEESLQ